MFTARAQWNMLQHGPLDRDVAADARRQQLFHHRQERGHVILCVRDPSESTASTNPFDINEAMDTVTTGMSWTNVPLAHFTNMTTQQAQPFFNRQATLAAHVIDEATQQQSWTLPILIHCSSGDRASAAFACFLIDYAGVSNSDAVTFATTYLALGTFTPFVQNYPKSTP